MLVVEGVEFLGGAGLDLVVVAAALARLTVERDDALVVLAGLALDRPRELGVGGRQDGLGELLEGLAGVVPARAGQHRSAALAGGERELAGVVLGGEDDERAAVELAGSLGAVDELPQPRAGGVDVAVGDLRRAGLAVLERGRLGRAVLVEDQPDAVGGDRARSVIAAAQVVGPVGPEQPVAELGRARDYADMVGWRRVELARVGLMVSRRAGRVGMASASDWPLLRVRALLLREKGW